MTENIKIVKQILRHCTADITRHWGEAQARDVNMKTGTGARADGDARFVDVGAQRYWLRSQHRHIVGAFVAKVEGQHDCNCIVMISFIPVLCFGLTSTSVAAAQWRHRSDPTIERNETPKPLARWRHACSRPSNLVTSHRRSNDCALAVKHWNVGGVLYFAVQESYTWVATVNCSRSKSFESW